MGIKFDDKMDGYKILKTKKLYPTENMFITMKYKGIKSWRRRYYTLHQTCPMTRATVAYDHTRKGHNTKRRTLTMITRSQKQDSDDSPKNNDETTTRKTAASGKRKKTDPAESTHKARRAKHMLARCKRMRKKMETEQKEIRQLQQTLGTFTDYASKHLAVPMV